MKKSEQNLRDLWETMKWINICIEEVPEGEERERIFEVIIAGNFPNSMKDMNINIKEAHRFQKMNSKRPTPRHIIINFQKQ